MYNVQWFSHCLLIEILVRFVWMEFRVHWSISCNLNCTGVPATSYREPSIRQTVSRVDTIILYIYSLEIRFFFKQDTTQEKNSNQITPVHRNQSHAICSFYFTDSSLFFACSSFIVLNCTLHSCIYKTTNNAATQWIPKESQDNERKWRRWEMRLPSGSLLFTQWNWFIYHQPQIYISLYLSILKSFWEMI